MKEYKPYKPIIKNCEFCGRKYLSKRKHSRFCCVTCRATAWRKEHPYLTTEELKEIKSKLGIE